MRTRDATRARFCGFAWCHGYLVLGAPAGGGYLVWQARLRNATIVLCLLGRLLGDGRPCARARACVCVRVLGSYAERANIEHDLLTTPTPSEAGDAPSDAALSFGTTSGAASSFRLGGSSSVSGRVRSLVTTNPFKV